VEDDVAVDVEPARRHRRRFGFAGDSWVALEMAAEARLARYGRLCNPRRGRCARKRPRAAAFKFLVQDKDPVTGRPVGDPYETQSCRDHRKWWKSDHELTIFSEVRLPPMPDLPPPDLEVDGTTGGEVRARASVWECFRSGRFGIGDPDEPFCDDDSEYVLLVVPTDSNKPGVRLKGAVPWRVLACPAHALLWLESPKYIVLHRQTMETFLVAEGQRVRDRASRARTGAA
jgi:hypothetical protein